MTLKQRLIVVMLLLANVLIIGALLWAGLSALGQPSIDDRSTEIQVAGARLATSPESELAAPTAESSSTIPRPQPSVPLAVTASSPISGVVEIPRSGGTSGWKYYQNRDDGWDIGVPATWQVLDVDPARLKSTLEAIRKKNPGIAAELEARGKTLSNSGFRFFAYDTVTAPPAQAFLTNANLIAEPLAAPTSLDAYVKVCLTQLARVKTLSGPVANRRVDLAAGPAAEIKYRVQVVNANGQPLMAGITQYVALRGQTAYMLTLTTTDSQAAGYAEVFSKIGQNLFWLNR